MMQVAIQIQNPTVAHPAIIAILSGVIYVSNGAQSLIAATQMSSPRDDGAPLLVRPRFVVCNIYQVLN